VTEDFIITPVSEGICITTMTDDIGLKPVTDDNLITPNTVVVAITEMSLPQYLPEQHLVLVIPVYPKHYILLNVLVSH